MLDMSYFNTKSRKIKKKRSQNRKEIRGKEK
jgi:hypothetical protein